MNRHQRTMDRLDRLDRALVSAQAHIHLVIDVLHSSPPHELSISSDHLLGLLLALSQQLETARDIADTELPETLGLKAARPKK